MIRSRSHRRRRPHSAQAGFTLVELMVSLVMFSFAIAGVLAVAVSMANGFREQRGSVGTEGAARSVMGFLADAVRGASPGIPTGQIIPADQSPCIPADYEAFAVTNDTTGPDDLTIVFAYGSVVTSSTQPFVSGTTTTLDVVDASQFAIGDHFVITDFGQAFLVKITNITGNQLAFTGAICGVGATIAAPAQVIRALKARFFVAPLDGVPTLFMDPDVNPTVTGDEEPLAEGIEDMQVAIGYDTTLTGDGVTEGTTATAKITDEWRFNVASDSLAVTALTTQTVRAVRISLVARTAAPVNGAGSFLRPALEDRAVGTADSFRRRVLTSTVEVRNMTGAK